MASNIDFSQVDLFAGIVIGAVAAAVVGFMFWRAKVVRFSWEGKNDQETSVPSSPYIIFFGELKEMISDLQKDIKDYVEEHHKCQRELPEKYVSWDVLNNQILPKQDKEKDKLEADRIRRWGEFDRHRHDPGSGILIKP